jgi:hypothetical protein
VQSTQTLVAVLQYFDVGHWLGIPLVVQPQLVLTHLFPLGSFAQFLQIAPHEPSPVGATQLEPLQHCPPAQPEEAAGPAVQLVRQALPEQTNSPQG